MNLTWNYGKTVALCIGITLVIVTGVIIKSMGLPPLIELLCIITNSAVIAIAMVLIMEFYSRDKGK